MSDINVTKKREPQIVMDIIEGNDKNNFTHRSDVVETNRNPFAMNPNSPPLKDNFER